MQQAIMFKLFMKQLLSGFLQRKLIWNIWKAPQNYML